MATGAVMAVPAHDQRDFEFAKKYVCDSCRHSPMTVSSPPKRWPRRTSTWRHGGQRSFQRTPNGAGKDKIASHAEEKGRVKKPFAIGCATGRVAACAIWGHAGFRSIYCDKCGTVPVPEEQLPVVLPEGCAIHRQRRFAVAREQASSSRLPVPSAAVMRAARPTPWTPSSIHRGTFSAMFRRDLTKRPSIREGRYWNGCRSIIARRACRAAPALARFFTKALRDLGLAKVDEPFTNLLTQGMVSKETYRCSGTVGFFRTELLGAEKRRWQLSSMRRPVIKAASKRMSKSKKNIVDPEDLVQSIRRRYRRVCLRSSPPRPRKISNGAIRALRALIAFLHGCGGSYFKIVTVGQCRMRMAKRPQRPDRSIRDLSRAGRRRA